MTGNVRPPRRKVVRRGGWPFSSIELECGHWFVSNYDGDRKASTIGCWKCARGECRNNAHDVEDRDDCGWICKRCGLTADGSMQKLGEQAMYAVHKTDRSRWQYEVRYNNGMVYARCDLDQHAQKIADALNAAAHNAAVVVKNALS